MNYPFRFLFSMLLLAGCILSGCKDEETTVPMLNEFPLQVGKKWKYHTEFTGITATPIETTWEVVRTETINGKLNYVIKQYQTEGDTHIHEAYYTNEANGLFLNASTYGGQWIVFKKEGHNSYTPFEFDFMMVAVDDTFFNDSLSIYDEPIHHLQYPVNIGDEWISYITDTDADTLIKRYDRAETVTTAAGTFETVVVTFAFSGDVTLEQYFSDSGLIKQVQTGVVTDSLGQPSGILTAVTELIFYN